MSDLPREIDLSYFTGGSAFMGKGIKALEDTPLQFLAPSFLQMAVGFPGLESEDEGDEEGDADPAPANFNNTCPSADNSGERQRQTICYPILSPFCTSVFLPTT